MAIDLEGKVELDKERDGEPLYFVIVRKAEGCFAFEFRDNCGKPTDAIPLNSGDLLAIGMALEWYSSFFGEESDE